MNDKLKNVVVALACLLVLTLMLDTAKTQLADWFTDQFVHESVSLTK